MFLYYFWHWPLPTEPYRLIVAYSSPSRYAINHTGAFHPASHHPFYSGFPSPLPLSWPFWGITNIRPSVKASSRQCYCYWWETLARDLSGLLPIPKILLMSICKKVPCFKYFAHLTSIINNHIKCNTS